MPGFRTVIPLPVAFPSLNYDSRILAVGSCFTENIGHRLLAAKFELTLNPTGILYNPHSIGRLLERLLEGRKYEPAELFLQQGLWHSYDHHSTFSMPDASQALEGINAAFVPVSGRISTYTHLFLALGTAYVYRHKATNQFVANCHKVPAGAFAKIRLSVPEITKALKRALRELKKRNPSLQTIITISPVRHLRDGLHENNLSKASLLLAAEQACKAVPDTYYFPSYEIVMDELRDYRFYADDMAHPSNLAVDYIWQRFLEATANRETQQILQRVMKIVQAARHRPFHPASSEHQVFLRKQLKLITEMEAQYPGMDWSLERAAFEGQLAG